MGIGPSLEDLLEDKDSQDDKSTSAELQSKIQSITIDDKEKEAEAKADELGIEYINLVGFAIGPDALTVIDKEESANLKTICFLNNGQEIRLATTDYNDEVKNKEAQLKEAAEQMAEKMKDIKITIGAKTSTKGKIFGSVNTIQLAEELSKSGFEIDRKDITIKDDLIKEVGSYSATVKLHREVKVEIPFEIVSE